MSHFGTFETCRGSLTMSDMQVDRKWLASGIRFKTALLMHDTHRLPNNCDMPTTFLVRTASTIGYLCQPNQ